MPKNLESCEVCGKETSTLFKRIIDNTLLKVCYNCKDYGDEPPHNRKIRIQEIENTNKNQAFQKIFPKSTTPIKSPQPFRKKTQHLDKYADYKVVDDAAVKLQKLRKELNLSPDKLAETLNLKKNYYIRIEKGEASLSLDIARRIEQKYKIKLIERDLIDEDDNDYTQYLKKNQNPPEGMIYFRKRGQAPEYDQDKMK